MVHQSPAEAIKPIRFQTLRLVWLLVVGSALQKLVPMTRWGHLIGQPGRPSAPQAPSGAPDTSSTAQQLTRKIERACQLLPYTPSCLAQAFAGQRVLIGQGHPGEVVIGLQRGQPGQWPAHAWLILDGHTITGGAVADRYYPATTYRVTSGKPDSPLSTTPTNP